MQSQPYPYRKLLLVCTNVKDNDLPCCGPKDSLELFHKLKAEMKAADPSVRVSRTGCLDQCASGITVVLEPDHLWFSGVIEANVPEIIQRALSKS